MVSHTGRGFVEEYLGDLISLDKHHEMILMGSYQTSKVLWFINSASTIQPRDIQQPTGSVVIGDVNHVKALRADKGGDFTVSIQVIRDLEARLSQVFLLNTSIQRAGERVTAEEIRYMAQELETAQGGAYSLLSNELQLPLIKRLLVKLKDQGALKGIPDEISPVIVAGFEALGRGHELNKLNQLVSMARQQFGEQAVAQHININAWFTEAATSLGIDNRNLINSVETVQGKEDKAETSAFT